MTLDPVARTARLTAAARARESARDDRLFDDPLAAVLAGDTGRALLAPLGDASVIAVRTRFFDDAVTRLFRTGTDTGTDLRQLVLLAAGMDTRAYRLDLPADTVLFELDRPELLDLKARLLAGVPAPAPVPRCIRRTVGVDLADDWPAALAAAGFHPHRPTCWLAEGLTPYLEESAVHRLLDRITALSAPGSHLLTDFVGRSLLESPRARPMLEALARSGAAWHFGTEEPELLLGDRNWRAEVTRVAVAGRAMGRRPDSVDAERTAPDAPQGYFVHGSR
ncbi:SAM-dependent methyltransferase [Streptomyces sp. XD-27]|uniref:class I SAM-dependent methyltransferase n=1 Tax=Streptomyces sp. XD-27 TaxID=3062779 RepID=UPI0026F47A10|nr:SAM-dependent methyltransferase [Streptomyces sp. XD-27]WKX69512.1 SAM-dependent methyltransferase [Streptomyces sp. XD-27]